MLYSRDELHWQAPTQNVDGTPIDYDLDYELGVLSTTLSESEPTPTLTVIGNLQEDGTYRAPLQLMSFEVGVYALYLRAINRDAPENVSGWSNSIGLVVSPNPIPAAPVLLAG